jgi:hypothetical protein
MEPLIDILAQLNENERIDFTSWFAGLSTKERESVAAVIARTTTECIRTILSISTKDRIALFLVKKNVLDEIGDSIEKTADDIILGLAKQADKAAERNRRLREGAWKPKRKHWLILLIPFIFLIILETVS